MRKGVIMEVQPRHWIVLTSDGEFVRIPRRNMALEVGEEVKLGGVANTFSSSIRKPWIAAVSAGVAAMLGMFFVLPQISPSEHGDTQGFVYLDVNPSIAINLDENENIIEVKPLNKSALRLLNKKTYKNEQVDDFVEQFLHEAKHNGYLHPKDQVILSGYDDEQTSVKALHKIEEVIDEESKEEKLDLNVHTLKLPAEVKEKADETGLSPAKYAVWRICNKEGKKLDVKEIEEMPITELARDIKPVSDFLNKPPSEEEWKEIIEEDEEQTDKEKAPTQEPDADRDKPTDSTQDPASEKSDEQQKEESSSKKEPDETGSSAPSSDQGSDTETGSTQDSNNTKKSNSSTVEERR